MLLLLNDNVIEKMWIEKGKGDNTVGDSLWRNKPSKYIKIFKT